MRTAIATIILAAFASTGQAAEITVRGDERCVTSDGTPDHSYGPFRARASLQTQDISFCFDASPVRTGRITQRVQVSGVTLSGIPLRPGTAEFYDAGATRLFPRSF